MDKKVQGVHAINQDFARYEQVDKRQAYRLSEFEGAEAFDESDRIRTCDLGRFLRGDAGDRRRFADELGSALHEIGFAVLTDTGIDPALYDEAAEKCIEVFTRPTEEDKRRFSARRHGSVNQGWFPIKETTDIHPDLVEGWVFCRRAFDLDPHRPFDAAGFWPVPELEPFFRRLCLAQEPLILPIMQAMMMYLGQDPHLFDARLTGTNFALRLNYYPPIDEADDRSGAGRLLGHEDVDLFTMLPAPQVEGLQVLDRRSMKWVRLEAPRSSIVLNTGDYMQRISNDVFPSTTHRVSKPRDPADRRRARVSFPMNVYLWEDEILEVLPGLGEPKYEPIDALTFHTRTTSKYYGDDYAVR